MDIDRILKKILEIDDLVSKKHDHSNKSIIDTITQALINNWNNAYTHISDTVKHITSTERTNWNDANNKKHTHSNKSILDIIAQSDFDNWDDKYTKNEVDNKISQVITNMDWKESVATYNDLATTYPNAEDGWTANTKDTDITYRYNGSTWIAISANSIPLATSSVDGKMSKSDKSKLDGVANNANNYTHPSTHPATMIVEDTTHRFTTDTEKSSWNDANSKKHTHSNWSILENITQDLLDSWSDAYTHVSDTVRHITSTERTNWNTAYTNNHTHSNKSIIDTITQALIDKWNSAYSHISDSIKHITSDERTLWNNKMSEIDSWRNKPQILSANTDLNEIYKSGIYTGDSDGNSASILNRPVTISQGFILYVYTVWNSEDVNGRQIQIYIARDGKMFTRSKEQSGSWQSWFKVYSENQKPTPSDIGASETGHTHTKANITDFPIKLSQFTNDSGFITQADVDTSQNHTHSNKSVLDKITQVLLDNWNSAYSHISDTIKHITSDERSLWNTVSNKLDKSGGTVTGAITVSSDSEISWNRNTDYAKIRFQNTGDSDTDSYMEFKTGDNGNEYFKFNQVNGSTTTELMTIKSDQLRFKGNNVYHTGNKPSASDIGLGSVDNTSDLNKPISTTTQIALNGKANSSHTHNYAGSSSSGGAANSAVKLDTARKINLNGDVIGSTVFDGSEDVSITTSSRQIAFVGSDVASSNGWYKVASQTMSGYGNTNIMFAVYSTYGNYCAGILELQMRTDNTTISCRALTWFSRYGFNINHFIVVINGMTWTLYAYRDFGQYGRLAFEILSSSSIGSKQQTWILNFSDNNSKEATTPTATITSSDGATVNYANSSGSATKATQDSDGKQINTTYVKKGMTWNDLEGV